jgi:hypothetical protein
MSLHHRPCALPDCNRAALRGRVTCKFHRGHPEGRALNQQVRRLSALMTDPDTLHQIAVDERLQAHRLKQQIDRGDFNELLAPTFSQFIEHRRATHDLTMQIGLNQAAMVKLLMDDTTPTQLANGLVRLSNENSDLIDHRTKLHPSK